MYYYSKSILVKINEKKVIKNYLAFNVKSRKLKFMGFTLGGKEFNIVV